MLTLRCEEEDRRRDGIRRGVGGKEERQWRAAGGVALWREDLGRVQGEGE